MGEGLLGPSKGEIDIGMGIDIDVGMDTDSDMAVSVKLGAKGSSIGLFERAWGLI